MINLEVDLKNSNALVYQEIAIQVKHAFKKTFSAAP